VQEKSQSLPQTRAEIDDALGLVCALPLAGRNDRRVALHDVIAQSSSSRELEHGVALAFDDTDEMARGLLDLILAERVCCAKFDYTLVIAPRSRLLELRVEAGGELVHPLKDLYLWSRTHE